MKNLVLLVLLSVVPSAGAQIAHRPLVNEDGIPTMLVYKDGAVEQYITDITALNDELGWIQWVAPTWMKCGCLNFKLYTYDKTRQQTLYQKVSVNNDAQTAIIKDFVTNDVIANVSLKDKNSVGVKTINNVTAFYAQQFSLYGYNRKQR